MEQFFNFSGCRSVVEFQLTVVGAAYKVEVYFYLAGYRLKEIFFVA